MNEGYLISKSFQMKDLTSKIGNFRNIFVNMEGIVTNKSLRVPTTDSVHGPTAVQLKEKFTLPTTGQTGAVSLSVLLQEQS